ncbi:hypothetical protein ACFLYU_05060 [Candidatus Dependentiae bacterium]
MIKNNNFVKIVKKLKLLVLALVIGSVMTPQTSQAFLGNMFKSAYEYVNNACKYVKKKCYDPTKKRYDDLKAKYEYTKKVTKITACSIASLLAYKKLVKPISRLMFGKSARPVIRTIDKGINISLLGMLAAGAFYMYDRFVAQGRILNKIRNAKTQILSHVTDTVTRLRDYIDPRLDSIDTQLSEVKRSVREVRNDVRDIKNKTTENNNLLKGSIIKTAPLQKK